MSLKETLKKVGIPVTLISSALGAHAQEQPNNIPLEEPTLVQNITQELDYREEMLYQKEKQHSTEKERIEHSDSKLIEQLSKERINHYQTPPITPKQQKILDEINDMPFYTSLSKKIKHVSNADAGMNEEAFEKGIEQGMSVEGALIYGKEEAKFDLLQHLKQNEMDKDLGKNPTEEQIFTWEKEEWYSAMGDVVSQTGLEATKDIIQAQKGYEKIINNLDAIKKGTQEVSQDIAKQNGEQSAQKTVNPSLLYTTRNKMSR